MCTHCEASGKHAFFGTKPIGMGLQCPTCGSNWSEGDIIASTGGESLSVIMGDVGSEIKKELLKVVWLVSQKGMSK